MEPNDTKNTPGSPEASVADGQEADPTELAIAARRHRRVDVAIPVRISTIDPETDPNTGRPFFRATREVCANLSRGGLYIKTTEPPSPGRRVLLELHLPDGRPLEAVGRVAWSKVLVGPHDDSRANGVGVEFLGAAAEQLEALRSFLDEGAED
ncbi:MAG: PilZ domain-containing protein [Myxococcales bacterium]|nr:PilZ domain-containing protein [Myxococcales bacterium]